MVNKRVEKQREELKKILERIVNDVDEINDIMSKERSRSRGVTHRSLEPKSGDYIVQVGGKFLQATYTANNGITYRLKADRGGE